MIQSVLTNMYEMESLLNKTEDIDWTVVRPPGLTNAPATGRMGQQEVTDLVITSPRVTLDVLQMCLVKDLCAVTISFHDSQWSWLHQMQQCSKHPEKIDSSLKNVF